jgi:hypothetical protein
MAAKALIAANLLVMANAALIGHRIALVTTGNPDFEGENAPSALYAPAYTAANWFRERDPSLEGLPGTPVSFGGAAADKILPRGAGTVLGVAFSFVTAPGAWAGHALGQGVTVSALAARQVTANDAHEDAQYPSGHPAP